MDKYFGTVTFDELRNLDDTNHLMFIGLTLDKDDTATLNEIETFFNDEGLFINGPRKIKGVRRVTGNVLGDKGRWDWVFDFEEDPGNTISPMTRLRMSNMGIKWVSDFVDNYKQDYKE